MSTSQTSGPPAAKLEKDASIETLRGIAIVLLVAFHAVDAELRNQTTAAGYSVFAHATFSLAYIRMPLFTVISGFVYALRPVRRDNVRPFLRGKARRILLPFVSVATLQYLLQALMPGVNSRPALGDIWRIYVFEYEHFWFLQAIALVFCTVTILDRLGWMNRLRPWLACVAAAGTLSLFVPRSSFFSLGGYVYLLPYFLLGCGLNRFADAARRPYVVVSALVVAVGGLLLQQLVWFQWLDVNTDTRSPLALSVGMCVLVVFFYVRRPNSLLARLGTYSYSIYLLHQFSLALAPRILLWSGANAMMAEFVLKVLLGLSLPIVADYVLKRSKPLRLVFLGLR